MKFLSIFILTLSSLSSFAACPDINGIYACTGNTGDSTGNVSKFETVSKEDKRGLAINGEIVALQGVSNGYCTDSSFVRKKNLGSLGTLVVEYTKLSDTAMNITYSLNGIAKSECVLIENN